MTAPSSPPPSYESFRKQLRAAEYEIELRLSAFSGLLVSKDFSKSLSLEQEIQALLNEVRLSAI
jgi:hypothetical protein